MNIKRLLLPALFAAVIVSCGDDDTPVMDNSSFCVISQSTTGCKNYIDSQQAKTRATANIYGKLRVDGLADGIVKITNEDIVCPCNSTVDMTASIKGNVITVDMTVNEAPTNCLCTIDASIVVGPLTEKAEYRIKLVRNGKQSSPLTFKYEAGGGAVGDITWR